jgi:hypothetical protein
MAKNLLNISIFTLNLELPTAGLHGKIPFNYIERMGVRQAGAESLQPFSSSLAGRSR